MVYYYKKKIPSIDDIVIARVEKISPYGIDVVLVEYNDIKGFINCNEVSRKKKVNLNKLLTVGKEILLNVIQVDEIKGYIDLSKRTISDEDIKLFTEKHKQYIQLYNIFKYIFMKLFNIEKSTIDEDKLYNFMSDTLWELQIEYENQDIISKLITKNSNLEILEEINYEQKNFTIEQLKIIINEYIKEKLNRIKPYLTETIKLMTYSLTGLLDIKYSLDIESFECYENLKNDFDIKLTYMTNSIYSIIIEQIEFDLKNSITIEDAISIVKTEIKKRAIEKNIQNQIVI